MKPLLKVQDLKVHFPVPQGSLRAVDGVSLQVEKGEVLGLVGESGCGKSTTGRAILQLLRPTSGQVHFDDQDLTAGWKKFLGRWVWSESLRAVRKRMQVIFQDPYASLNPRMTVESIIREPLDTFNIGPKSERRAKVQSLMDQVGMAARYIRRYPHEFSGGQRQRIGIARALALEPEMIIADEPVSALDVSIQAQILNLLAELKEQRGLTYIFIAHDLAAVRHISDRIAVMYLGRIVEIAPTDVLFSSPKHPYTKALISAVPVPDPKIERARKRLVLSSDVPSPIDPPSGCPFHPRCAERIERCSQEVPQELQVGHEHRASCHLIESAHTEPQRS